MLGLPNVKTHCLENLNDKRERSWDEHITSLLDDKYSDWRSPKGTYMVPDEFLYKNHPPDFGEQTEKKFFDLLKNFGETHQEPMFVVHSYHFKVIISDSNDNSNKKERKWVFGEHDFVIIHHIHGIIFFQVKAAKNRRKTCGKAKRQLEIDLKSAEVSCNEDYPNECEKINSVIHRYPGFVVMPNCSRGYSSVPKKPDIILKEDCENENAFSKWWNNNVADIKSNTHFEEMFKYLVMRYVGLSLSIPFTLSDSIEESKRLIDVATADQMKLFLDAVRERWITGPAGSGKTWVLMKKVTKLIRDAHWRRTNEKILVVCYNKPLSLMLDKTFKDELMNIEGNEKLEEVVTVKTFDSLLLDIVRSKLGSSAPQKANVAQALELVEEGIVFTQSYDHIFVDECQDLCGDKWPTLFKRLHKDDADANVADDVHKDDADDMHKDDADANVADDVHKDDADDMHKDDADANVADDAHKDDADANVADDVHTDDDDGDDDDDDDDDDGDDDEDDWCEPKCIWFFYDTNQNLGNSTEQNQLHRKSIEESFWLAKVCRNTQVVFEHSKKYFMSKIPNAKPIELGHNIVGLEIQWDGSLTSQDVEVEYGTECIKKHINNLRAEKVDDKDICILTQNIAIRDEIRRVLKKMEIQSQNAEQMFQNDDNKVVVESIWRFKGLESKVVILYNPPVISYGDWTTRKIKELLYIAFSRCFCYLIVVSTSHGCNKLKSKKRLSESPSK